MLRCTTEIVTSEDALAYIGSGFAPQSEGESMAQFLVRLKKSYIECRKALTRMNMAHLLPHPDSLVNVVYSKARIEFTKIVKSMVSLSDTYDETNMNLEVVSALYNKAALRAVRSFKGLEQAIDAAKRVPKSKPVQPPDTSKGGVKGAPKGGPKGAKGAKGNPKGAPAPAPDTPLKPPLQQPTSTAAHKYVDNPSTHLRYSTVHTQWMAENRCLHCGEDGLTKSHFPKHTVRECPYSRRDGEPWRDTHVPITAQENTGLVDPSEVTQPDAPPYHLTLGEDPDDNLPPDGSIRMDAPPMSSGVPIATPLLADMEMPAPEPRAGDAAVQAVVVSTWYGSCMDHPHAAETESIPQLPPWSATLTHPTGMPTGTGALQAHAPAAGLQIRCQR